MKTVVADLQQVLQRFVPALSAIPQQDFSAKPLPSKWSRQEVIGHLVDSAQNNLRRFIVGQYDHQPNIVYQQDFWVNANAYQQCSQADVIALWRLVNEQICRVLLQMPEVNHSKVVNTGKNTPEHHTLIWLAEDYVKHMKHHLNQVIPGSFDVRYP